MCVKCAEKRKGESHLDARSDDGGGRDSALGNPVSYVFSKDGLDRCSHSVITAAPIFAKEVFGFGKF